MADNPTPSVQPPTPGALKKPVHEEAPDAGHVPMGEEFDSARWTLPPIGIVGIALGVLAVLVAIVMFVNRAKPVAVGTINNVNAVQLPDNTVMVSVQLGLTNITKKPWVVEGIRGIVNTDQGEKTDEAATASDAQRYTQAFPALAEPGVQFWTLETKLNPGQNGSGLVIFSFPMTKEQFDARKSFAVRLKPYDNVAVTFK